ncbi:hypothetical protein HanXRQr2_Chr05g0205281 [Helianthus annuus]|uniref:Uncharacterized protein n=1 Tax=Helianthus annuus TaxID=4232 RepID=A0A9K3NLX4_HELAN|nr:hypothetical protein HanXRQr2_Chr05g0205281 [Helianthus annuus]KAJ0921974.1 hypothetical protein HanPSC8_Chr05g0198051 [Helianthus annuus]
MTASIAWTRTCCCNCSLNEDRRTTYYHKLIEVFIIKRLTMITENRVLINNLLRLSQLRINPGQLIHWSRNSQTGNMRG